MLKQQPELTATISLGSGSLSVGRQRILLLEEVERCGSIAAAARSVGLTYKAAWEAIRAMQNLVNEPLLRSKIGGRRGGGAVLTPAGQQLTRLFHRLEAGLASMVRDAHYGTRTIGLSPRDMTKGSVMQSSARNALTGEVVKIDADGICALIDIQLTPEVTLRSQITRKSLENLGLIEGGVVTALVKASFIRMARKNHGGIQNAIPGQLKQITLGADSAELVIDIGLGKTLVAVQQRTVFNKRNWLTGEQVVAHVRADQIILAVAG